MDLNERLAARRKELADEADRARREADRLRQAELEAARQAARAKAAAEPPLPQNNNFPSFLKQATMASVTACIVFNNVSFSSTCCFTEIEAFNISFIFACMV